MPSPVAGPRDGRSRRSGPASPVAQAETVESYESTGSNGSAVFVVLAADPLQAIRLEALRRQKLLVAFVDESRRFVVGPRRDGLRDGAGGAVPSKLEISKNGRFILEGP